MKKLLLIITTIFLFNSGIIAQVVNIKKTYFEENIDTDLKVPRYSYYVFTKQNRKVNQTVPRSATFHQEPALSPKLQGNNSDYAEYNKLVKDSFPKMSAADLKKHTFDKGHYAPNDDFRFNAIAESENMCVSGNTAPQISCFNENQWRAIEDYERVLGEKYDSLVIYTGGVFGKNPMRIGKNRIAVPTHYFKTILVKSGGKVIGAIGFLSTNKYQVSKDIKTFIVPISTIEKMLGVDLYKGNNSYELSIKFLN
jgi:DNA/RNA endonuclease G (NUC1)